MTNTITDVTPESVLESLLTTAAHPTKRRNLTLIHKTCLEHHGLGSKDFSLKAIGAAVEARGGLKAKALWNAQSADYRKLIEAWQAFAGGGPPMREVEKIGLQQTLARSIPDPATRIIVEQLVRERNTLRAEVNILKAHASITIDHRPPATMPVRRKQSDGTTVEIHSGPDLNQIEREALEHAISAELWDAEGWKEEKHGRVVKPIKGTSRSRTIFKPGFTSAIRKLLGRK